MGARPPSQLLISRMEYVSQVLDDTVVVESMLPVALAEALSGLPGAEVGPGVLRIPYTDKPSLAAVLTALRDHGLPLVGVNRAGWSPGEIFEYFREQGLVSGKYIEVVWTGLPEPVFSEK